MDWALGDLHHRFGKPSDDFTRLAPGHGSGAGLAGPVVASRHLPHMSSSELY